MRAQRRYKCHDSPLVHSLFEFLGLEILFQAVLVIHARRAPLKAAGVGKGGSGSGWGGFGDLTRDSRDSSLDLRRIKLNRSDIAQTGPRGGHSGAFLGNARERGDANVSVNTRCRGTNMCFRGHLIREWLG